MVPELHLWDLCPSHAIHMVLLISGVLRDKEGVELCCPPLEEILENLKVPIREASSLLLSVWMWMMGPGKMSQKGLAGTLAPQSCL